MDRGGEEEGDELRTALTNTHYSGKLLYSTGNPAKCSVMT